MSEFALFGSVSRELDPHPLIPEGYVFDDHEEFIVTEWGDILPSVSFSLSQLRAVTEVADRPRLDHESSVVVLAKYLSTRVQVSAPLACWELPLKQEYDSKNRARYPAISLAALGYKNQPAHRATLETFMGIPLPRGEARWKLVDHRCRNHACCNPYHLEVVTAKQNNQRGVVARKRIYQPDFFQLATGSISLSDIGRVDLIE